MSIKIEYKSLTSQAYQIIKNMILNSELKPGKRIIEEKLGKEMGISRTTVKRALAKLVEDGLLEEKPFKGSYVKNINLNDILDIYNVREVLEGLAARLAADLIENKKLLKMKKILKKAEDCIKKEDYDSYVKLDNEFHEILAKASKNIIIFKMINNFNIRKFSFNIGLIRPVEETLVEHRAIIDAIDKHNSDLSEKLVRDHISNTRERILNKYKK